MKLKGSFIGRKHVLTIFGVLAVSLMTGAVSQAAEYRGLWVDTWNPGILDEVSARLMVERARQHHFNTLFIEACKTMDAYYQSDLLPQGENVPPGYDPLATVLRFSKPANTKVKPLETHAWIVAFRVWKDKPLPSKTASPKHVMYAHPEWLSKTNAGSRQDEEGNHFLDPGVPEVQEFIVGIAKEIVGKYPVDGLHLDYVRYPGSEWGYNTTALARFQDETGRKDVPAPKDEQWSDWRRRQVTDLVKRVAVEIKALRPQIKLSAATITWGGVPDGDFTKTRAYQDALQDWVKWSQQGYIDINAPMNYKRANHPGQAQDFVDWTKLARATNTHRHLVIGLGGWMNPLDGSSRQTQVARKLGSDGVAFFSYNQLEASGREQAPVIRDISGKIFREPASVPAASWIQSPRTGLVAGVDPKKRSGYPVLLLDAQKKEIARVRTDANGRFAFFNVRPGDYRAQVGLASILSEPFRMSAGKVVRAAF